MTDRNQTTLRERILDRASDILGSGEAAERWMSEPAMALDQRRPEDLIQTP